MSITIQLPRSIEKVLRSSGADPSESAKESLLVELYRQKRITSHQLGEALGLGRYEVDGVLKRHNVPLEITIDEFHTEIESLRDLDGA